jgi:hypothetical protein
MREPGRFARGVLVSAAIGVFAIVLVGTLLLALVGFGIGGHVSALIPVLLIGYALYAVVRRGFEMRRLATEGVETSGTVTRKVTFRGRGSHRRYQITYAYHDAFGREHSRRSVVSRELYDSLEVGSPVTVVYLPDRPSVSGLLSDVEDARRALERRG